MKITTKLRVAPAPRDEMRQHIMKYFHYMNVNWSAHKNGLDINMTDAPRKAIESPQKTSSDMMSCACVYIHAWKIISTLRMGENYHIGELFYLLRSSRTRVWTNKGEK
jgi:hypothetical protein